MLDPIIIKSSFKDKSRKGIIEFHGEYEVAIIKVTPNSQMDDLGRPVSQTFVKFEEQLSENGEWKLVGDVEFVTISSAEQSREFKAPTPELGFEHRLQLLAVDIVSPYKFEADGVQQKSWIPAAKLEIANWWDCFERRTGAIDTLKPEWVDEDERAFRIRVPLIHDLTPVTYISTESLLDEYNDPKSEISIVRDQYANNNWYTDTQILVTDSFDDDIAPATPSGGPDESATDRTHLILPFGTVTATIDLGSATGTIILPVPAPDDRLSISLRMVIVRDKAQEYGGTAPLSEDVVKNEHVMHIAERLAMANIIVLPHEVEVVTVDPPEGVDLTDGLDIGTKDWYKILLQENGWVPISTETRSLFEALGTPENTSDYTIFVINNIKEYDVSIGGGTPNDLGLAWLDAVLSSNDKALKNNAIILAGKNNTTPTASIHELGHLLTNEPFHYNDYHADGRSNIGISNIMFGGASSLVGQVVSPKRLEKRQIDVITENVKNDD